MSIVSYVQVTRASIEQGTLPDWCRPWVTLNKHHPDRMFHYRTSLGLHMNASLGTWMYLHENGGIGNTLAEPAT